MASYLCAQFLQVTGSSEGKSGRGTSLSSASVASATRSRHSFLLTVRADLPRQRACSGTAPPLPARKTCFLTPSSSVTAVAGHFEVSAVSEVWSAARLDCRSVIRAKHKASDGACSPGIWEKDASYSGSRCLGEVDVLPAEMGFDCRRSMQKPRCTCGTYGLGSMEEG